MATVTIADDQGNVIAVIGVDNTETGEGGLPHAEVCFDGAQVDQGERWCADAGLHQIKFLKAVLDALHHTREHELEYERDTRPDTRVWVDHEQRLMQLEAHLPKQGWQPPAAATRPDLHLVPRTDGQHVAGCHQGGDQAGFLWHDPAGGCQRPDEHPNWRQ